MATATVSASVNAQTKHIVSTYLDQAGTTANEVIKSLWEHIAATGEIPSFVPCAQDPSEEEPEAFRRLMELRARVPHGTSLATMSPADLKDELRNRDV